MPPPKWLVVARNEYRLHLNHIRPIRPYFPVLVIALLAIYVAVIAPAVVGLVLDDVLAFLLSQVALVMIPIIMFLFFLYLVVLPITYTLQSMQAGQVEIFLAAPITPSDVLLGEFLGVVPFYAIAIAVLAGTFTATLTPLGLDLLQIGLTVAIFVVTLLSALWIGTVIAAVVRTRFAASARGRDIGKALSLVLALPMVAVMYAIMGGGLLEALADPGTRGLVRAILGLLPSTWGAELILQFAANPGNLGAVGVATVTRLGGLLTFGGAVLAIGTRVARRAYSIEPTTFTTSTVRPDGVFYRGVKALGGGESFGTLLVALFKDYGRRLENLSRIAYIVAIFVMVNVFLVGGFTDSEGSLVMAQFLVPFLAVFMVGQVTVQGKANLFLYKQTPEGVGRFVKAKLVQGWLVAVPVAGAITLISLLLGPHASVVASLTHVGLITLLVAGNVLLALGLALLNPQFSDSARAQMGSLMLNANIAMFTSIGVFIAAMVFLDWGIVTTLVLQNAVIWLLGLACQYLGKLKLSRIE